MAAPTRSSRRKIISAVDFGYLKANLNEVATFYIAKALWVMVHSMVHCLSIALPRTPVETGKLRESAHVNLRSRKFGGSILAEVARGRKDGSLRANFGEASSAIATMSKKEIRVAGVEILYNRVIQGNFDVAQFTHEELQPYRGRPNKPRKLVKPRKRGSKKTYMGRGPDQRTFYARVPGTGPKYLERTWNENKAMYSLFYREALSGHGIAKDLKRHLNVKKHKKGTHDVNVVKLSIGAQAYKQLERLGGLR